MKIAIIEYDQESGHDGRNLHRASQPMLEGEGYDGSRAGWKERARVVKELGNEAV